jgi:ParB family transcriptional regulator, chromosome partitioning protein
MPDTTPALRNSAIPRTIPIGDIVIPDDGLRRTLPSQQDDLGLLSSVRSLGVLQPIIVRPHPLALGRYIIVDGRRRLVAAQAAGADAIAAEVRDLDDREARAIEAAANMQRCAMSPVDQWRAVTHLESLGWTIDDAAAALGLPPRLARRLAKLGNLHPDMLDAMASHGLPGESQLATIAAADPDAQAAALAKHGKGAKPDWWTISAALRTTRMPRAEAIFDADASGLHWDEDLFAEPGSRDQWTTRDVAGFLAAQKAALDAAAETSKGRIVLAEDHYGRPKLPAGVDLIPEWRWGEPVPKGCTVYALLNGAGFVVATCTRKAAKPAASAEDPVDVDGDEVDGADEGDTRRPGARQPGTPRRFDSQGVKMLQRIRTAALCSALADRPAPDPVAALRLLLVALGATNVMVEHDDNTGGRLGEVAAAAIHAGDNPLRLAEIAMQAMARILITPVPGERGYCTSGPAAEWIGHAIGAEACLPRTDTPELLATASGDALADACRAAGVTPGRSADATRKALAGSSSRPLFPEALFAPTRFTFETEDYLPPPEDCGRAAGRKDCTRCGWSAKGTMRNPCERIVWDEGLRKLGLAPEDIAIDEKGLAHLVEPAPKPAPPPEDHAAQRAEDAKAFDAPPPAFECAWLGVGLCREHGTMRCDVGCDRKEKYQAWLATKEGAMAKAAENRRIAKENLRATGLARGPRRKKDTEA